MVQLLLDLIWRRKWRVTSHLLMAMLLVAPQWAAGKSKSKTTTVQVPELQLEGGRKLTFERSLTTDRDVRPSPASLPRYSTSSSARLTCTSWFVLTAW